MESANGKKVLISGASIAGLSTACLLTKLGYTVTVVEQANEPRTAGAAVDIRGLAVDISKRMGIFDQLDANRLRVERIEFKEADDSTAGSIALTNDNVDSQDDDIEIERDIFINSLFDRLLTTVTFLFNNTITTLAETNDGVYVTLKDGTQQTFDLVIGCDGLHSIVRHNWFGHEADYAYFMEAYFSITTVSKLLINEKTMQLFNVPDKAITLNAYNKKTDIIFSFFSQKEIPYNYRDIDQQRAIILNQFAGQGWRTNELLTEVQQSDKFYFDKFCQIKMPSWTKGRVALVGDAGYCASPAAGMGASLSVIGAAALADALEKHSGNLELAFQEYNQTLRPFIDEVQATAELNVKENFIPRTEEAIHRRNTQTTAF
jgi:2-polyprenyl-6-methoxyphenol hydroxylase-like FAD-dependent oxidoreductase